MGQKDLTQKNLECYPDVFADTVNALLYNGVQVLLPDTLQPAPTETLYHGKDNSLCNQFHDVSQYVMQSDRIKIQYTLENETKASSKMILRKAGYEGAVYRSQYENLTKDIYPIISLVLHWGEYRWKSSKSLLELILEQNLPNATMNCIDDMRLRVYDMRFLTKEVREKFTSDMRIIVDYLAEGDDYQPTSQPIIHVKALLLMLKELSGDFRYEDIISELETKPTEKGDITMCGLLDKYEARGIAKGEQRVNQLISLLLKQSRWDEISKVVSDKEYQQMLFREYGI